MAIIGAGKVGTALARALIDAGHKSSTGEPGTRR
ncbi:NAD(P)-binding domain-containing protein [Nocardia fusca]|uniref:NAD(P)-binding domain-containing protein n=1 Tax=Nocardia fusca TaxID=941183 RepID=A0ABV3FGV2_9NOCA